MATLGFTRASDHSNPSPSSCTLSGQEARQFYEDLIRDGEGSSRKIDTNHSRKKTGAQSRRLSRRGDRNANGGLDSDGGRVGSSGSRAGERGDGERRGELQGLRLLRCAHEGDTSALKDLLSKGADINFQDSYWWTGLMCASWAGHRAAVKLLLQRGAAWVGVVDLQGRDAMDLAMEAGHNEVVEEFDIFGTREMHKTKPAQSAHCLKWCKVCNMSYPSPSSSHHSSTLHQFNLHRPPPTPHYCLPPSSAGYKMMLCSGWTPGSGLGPEGSGVHYPVPTFLKQDTQGLGYGLGKKAKVTHFKAGDTKAVEAPEKRRREEKEGRGVRREEARSKEQREKIWERDFRSSFYL